jgi:HPt (histidine-containing phosphotransfer) domain-containing protein
LDTLLDELAQIEGFDVQEAMAHMGDCEEALAEVLQIFCEEFDNQIGALKNALSKEDWKDYSIRIHALKGSFANIGMPELSLRAKELEMASKSGDIQKCKEITPEVCQAMNAAREALHRTSLFKGEVQLEKVPVDGAFVREKLLALENACINGMSEKAEEAARALKEVSVNELVDAKLSELYPRVITLDYTAVLPRIRELRTMLPL